MTSGTGVNAPLIGILTNQTATGTMVDTFTTAVTVITAAARKTLPGGFWYVGRLIRISALFAIKNVVTAQPTFTFQVMLGPTSNIIVWSSGAVTCSTTANASLPVELVIWLKCVTVGAGTAATLQGIGKLTGQGFVVSGATANSALTHTTLMLPFATPAPGTGFSSVVANILDLFVACQTSDANNGVQVFNYIVEDMS